MTLARFFSKLRSDSGLSLRALANKVRPKVDPATIWKIESGRPVRAKTLGQVLRGLGLTEIDNAYIEAFALWSTEQSITLPLHVVTSSRSRVQKKQSTALDALIAQAADAITAIPDGDRPLLVEALRNPEALVLWVKSTRAARGK